MFIDARESIEMAIMSSYQLVSRFSQLVEIMLSPRAASIASRGLVEAEEAHARGAEEA